MKLDDIYLWQDESDTAVLGINTLIFGYPKVWDGKNIVATMPLGPDSFPYNEDLIWTHHQWFQNYLAAASFALLGKSTFAARFPFVLAGLLATLAIFIYAKTYSKSVQIALFSAAYQALSLPVILYSRQCRYYALILLFSPLVMTGYLLLFEQKWKLGFIIFSGFSLCLYYSSYYGFLFIFSAIAVDYIFCRRFERFIVFFSSLSIIMLGCLPWFLYARPDKSAFDPGASHTWEFIYRMYKNILQLNYYHLPILVLVCYVFNAIFFNKLKIPYEQPLIVVSINIFLASALLWTYDRYLLPCLPFLAYIFGWLTWKIWIANRYLGAMFFLVAALTNIINYGTTVIIQPIAIKVFPQIKDEIPSREQFLYIPMKQYLQQLASDYEGPIETLCQYLNTHAKSNETLYTNYAWESYIFYTELRLVNRMARHHRKLSEYIQYYLLPDWIILRQWPPSERMKIYLAFCEAYYDKIVLPVKDIRWENRPDPRYHLYISKKDEPHVTLWQKKSTKKLMKISECKIKETNHKIVSDGVTIENAIEFQTFKLNESQILTGKTMRAALIFYCKSTPIDDLAFSIRFHHQNGFYEMKHTPRAPSTSEWPAEKIIEDWFTFQLPEDFPPGKAEISIMVWNFSKMKWSSFYSEKVNLNVPAMMVGTLEIR